MSQLSLLQKRSQQIHNFLDLKDTDTMSTVNRQWRKDIAGYRDRCTHQANNTSSLDEFLSYTPPIWLYQESFGKLVDLLAHGATTRCDVIFRLLKRTIMQSDQNNLPELQKLQSVVTFLKEPLNNWQAPWASSIEIKRLSTVIESLLTHPPDVNVRDECSNTPLHIATSYGYKAIVKVLLESGAEVNATDKYDRQALHCTAEGGHVEIINLLLKKRADVAAKDHIGRQALDWTAEGGHVDSIKLLLDRGAKIDAVDEDGDQALHYAARNRKIEVVNHLLENNADITAQNCDGHTPAMIARERDNEDLAQWLEQHARSLAQ